MAYLGNDATDEDAFGALTHWGLNILVREDYRPTLADAWIRPPEALLDFLHGWIAACRVNDDNDCESERENAIRKSTIHDKWRRKC